MDNIIWMIKVIFSLLFATGYSKDSKDRTEFCQNEKFEAKCEYDEIIVMTYARYGRMKKSRCVVKNYGFMPCQREVLDVGDYFCSGRQKCTINVPNDLLDKRKTCPQDFVSYLEADYVCKKVITRSPPSCQAHHPPQYVQIHQDKGLLSSVIATEQGCGSHKAPWMITATPGQTINFTLHDFSYLTRAKTSAMPNIAYAVIKEPSIRKSYTLWARESRVTQVYTSQTNMVQIVFQGSENVNRYFAIEYSVNGCSDLTAPTGGWMMRKGNNVTMGCNMSSSGTWKLRCDGNTWKGPQKNCTSAVPASVGQWNSNWSLFSISIEMALVLIAGIAFIIAMGIILLGIICLKRNNLKTHRNQIPLSTDEWNSATQHNIPPPAYQTDPAKYSGSIRSQENEYASIQENNYGTARLSNYTPVNMNDVIQNEHTHHVVHHVIRDSHVKEPDIVRFAERDIIKERPPPVAVKPPCIAIKPSQVKINNNNRQCYVGNQVNSNTVHDERAYSY